jgi:Protein of unknown function (DUF962)
MVGTFRNDPVHGVGADQYTRRTKREPTVSQLIRRQWQDYPQYHQSRANLLLHITAVPVFLLANVALVVAVARGLWPGAVVAVAAMVASIAAQGRGHRWEPVPPEPFTGISNALARIFCEQWVTFPRLVLSGGWFRALQRDPGV